MMKYIFFYLTIFCLVMISGEYPHAAEKSAATSAKKITPVQKKGMPAQKKTVSGRKNVPIKNWAFGQSALRNDLLWKKGFTARQVESASIPKKRQNNTKKIEAREVPAHKFSGGMNVETQQRSWDDTPGKATSRADEKRFREGRHVFRAFADMAPSKELDINIGPELILKDSQAENHVANSTQPDTVLGMGMNFRLDF